MPSADVIRLLFARSYQWLAVLVLAFGLIRGILLSVDP